MEKERSAKNNIKTAFLMNLLFVIVEAVGGALINSVAVMSDAVHDLGDCIALGGAWVLEGISGREPDESYTYGYRRFSVLSALLTLAILVVGSGFMMVMAIKRVIRPQEVKAGWMLLIAVLGVLINGYAAYKTVDRHNANERAINLHMLEDVLGWAAVLVGSALIWIFKAPRIDGILSLLVSIFVLVEAVRGLPDTLAVFLERAPRGFDTDALARSLRQVEEVTGVHHLHVWSLSDVSTAATAHIAVAEDFDFGGLKDLYAKLEAAAKTLGVGHITCQIEPGGACESPTCHTDDEQEEEHGHHHHHG